jgi:hypothetical protein
MKVMLDMKLMMIKNKIIHFLINQNISFLESNLNILKLGKLLNLFKLDVI